ncbi:helix-turn-helix domain-containing protein, partial [Klebsiella pneumoniae]|uniref:helix-turn-helix domain-containing protein n=1 Tax=Klebsiella pneumoniae TaxID=573 RepID=UPI001E60373F
MKARLENIIDHIRDVPRTVPQIAADLSLPRTSVHRYVFALHLRKMVHIDGWDSAGAKYAPSFLAGAGEDTPRPMRKIERQRDARKHTPMVVLDDSDEAPISPCKPAGTVTVAV